MRTAIALCLLAFVAAHAAVPAELRSPDGALEVRVDLDAEGRPGFRLFRDGDAVIRRSPLGVTLDAEAFVDDLRILSVSGPTTVGDRYRLWTGKQRDVHYEARELRVHLANRDGHRVDLAMRLSDDGLAYRHEFPGDAGETYRVVAEHGGVHFHTDTRAWLQPKAEAQSGWMNVNPSYEEDYHQDIPVGAPSPTASGWVYPALFRYRNHWIVLSETGMDGSYPGTNLAQDSEDGLYRLRFPQDAEVLTGGNLLAESRRPFHTPWRILVVGDLDTVMASTLGTDLAEPLALETTDFIEPGIAAWSWGLLKDESVTHPAQKEFIDYAARMHWPYVLVDVDWDQRIGYDRIAELAEYAAGKGVALFLWYNSSGAWNETVYSPKSRLLTGDDRRAEFARLRDMGIGGVKVDFFPGDGASVMQYYVDILRDAADHELMVNFHGTTLPRGLQRTYPNLVTSEAIKGFEFITFFQEFADQEATHVAMLPFTRNLFDPMDFTPTVLGDIPDRERRTSDAFQLALPVLLLSGVQHLVTTPAQMRDVPEDVCGYLRSLPGQWDESRFIDGYPGRFAVIARRAGARWYVAGVNALERRRLEIDPAFTGAERGVLIRDGEGPRQVRYERIDAGPRAIELAAGAGFVMVFDTQTGE